MSDEPSGNTATEGAGEPRMDTATFRRFREFIYEQSGITLREGKESLVMARIGKRMRANGIETPGRYLEFVMEDKSGRELVEMLDAISTNLTFFFREPAHFDFLRKVLAEWRAQGQLRYRLWCAAASTGEEPYSMAMVAADTLGEGRADLRILATDISTRVLRTAREGVYDEQRVRSVPPAYMRFFDADGPKGATLHTVKPLLREVVHLRRLNLATPPFPMRGPMDIVFCRNVMIYFDTAVRTRLVAEVHRLLRPDGYLVVGHSESLTGIRHGFKPVQPAVYQKT